MKTAVAAASAATAAINQPAGAAADTESELQALTASKAVDAIARGEVTAEAYARALLARAEARKDLDACIALNRDGVMEGARAIDVSRSKGERLGRLAGLPLLVKDNIDAKGLPTTAGTKGLAGNRPKEDAPVLSPLLQSGALLMSKTNMHELAFGITSTNAAYGAVKNPYNKDDDSGRLQRRDSSRHRCTLFARRAGLRYRRLSANSSGLMWDRRAAAKRRQREQALSGPGRRANQSHTRHSRADGADCR